MSIFVDEAAERGDRAAIMRVCRYMARHIRPPFSSSTAQAALLLQPRSAAFDMLILLSRDCHHVCRCLPALVRYGRHARRFSSADPTYALSVDFYAAYVSCLLAIHVLAFQQQAF